MVRPVKAVSKRKALPAARAAAVTGARPPVSVGVLWPSAVVDPFAGSGQLASSGVHLSLRIPAGLAVREDARRDRSGI